MRKFFITFDSIWWLIIFFVFSLACSLFIAGTPLAMDSSRLAYRFHPVLPSLQLQPSERHKNAHSLHYKWLGLLGRRNFVWPFQRLLQFSRHDGKIRYSRLFFFVVTISDFLRSDAVLSEDCWTRARSHCWNVWSCLFDHWHFLWNQLLNGHAYIGRQYSVLNDLDRHLTEQVLVLVSTST